MSRAVGEDEQGRGVGRVDDSKVAALGDWLHIEGSLPGPAELGPKVFEREQRTNGTDSEKVQHWMPIRVVLLAVTRENTG